METNHIEEYEVFISYSRKDFLNNDNEIIPNNIISQILDAFTKANVKYWYDKDGISGGDQWNSKVADAIENSKIFVFISSNNSNNQSKWTSKEIAVAYEYEKRIIPFRLDKTKYSKNIIGYIADLDYIEYQNNTSINKLVKDVQRHLNEINIEEQKRVNKIVAEEERRKQIDGYYESLDEVKEHNAIITNEILNLKKKINELTYDLDKCKTTKENLENELIILNAKEKKILKQITLLEGYNSPTTDISIHNKIKLKIFIACLGLVAVLIFAIVFFVKHITPDADIEPILPQDTIIADSTYQMVKIAFKAHRGDSIIIDGEKYGTGEYWRGNLSCGEHRVEIRHKFHHPVDTIITLSPANEGDTIRLEETTAITGSVKIEGMPTNAILRVNNKIYSVSKLKNIVIGKHRISIKEDGYESFDTIVHVKQDDLCTLEYKRQEKVVNDIINTKTPIGPDKYVVYVGNLSFTMIRVDKDSTFLGKKVEDFYIGETEVTQALWEEVMGSNPSIFKGDDFPVTNLKDNDIQQFIKRLDNLTMLTFRLPTEAEWRYAAIGGNRSKGYKYAGSNNLNHVATYGDKKNGPQSVRRNQPNELDLYDMNGNVWELCQSQIMMGGAWNSSSCNNTSRESVRYSSSVMGFRLVLTTVNQ